MYNGSTLQFLDLPLEIIHKILCSLSPIELVVCQLVSKHLNTIISQSLTLQYIIALALAKADDNPCSVLPLPQKLEDIRSSEAAWSTLQPKFIASLPVKHRTSGIYDLSAGSYLLGNADRMALQYLQLPTRVDDPLDWKKITIDKAIIDMGFCIFEHDLIAIFTSTPSAAQLGSVDIEMSLLEYSTGKPHPMAKNSTVFIVTSSTRPSLMCEIVGENLVLILNFGHHLHGDDRVFIWNWRTTVQISAFQAPRHTYSGIIVLEEDLIILPNAKSAAFDVFRIPKKPTAVILKPVFSLQLPSLSNDRQINTIICRAEPNPIADISRLNKRRRAQERADAGMDEMDPLSPKKGFLASAHDAICIFQIRFENGDEPVIFHGGINVQFEPHSFTLFVHRSSFLNMARRYEGIPDAGGLPVPEDDSATTSGPRRIAWADWGPPVSRWFDANDTPTRWITTSAGQRCAIFQEDVGAYGTPIKILDFNPFNVSNMKAKERRENEIMKRRLGKLIVGAKLDGGQPVLPSEMELRIAADEVNPLPASKVGEQPSFNSHVQTETATSQPIPMQQDSQLVEISFLSDEMDVVEDDDHESWVTTDDDDDSSDEQNPDEDNSIPGLESVIDSDEEPHTSWATYTTNTQDHRHPGRARCRVFDAPSSVDWPGIFAEEVEGRLPYVAILSETEYEYDGVLLDEERMLGITTDRIDRISAIDIFYFG